ncbi:MAG: imidazolonepropionase [Verrucomicrobia bacterium]|nr:imidazolonepropionase [Verrucomicrobiota bacterium]
MPRDLIIVNCKQLVTLAGPPVPRVGRDLNNLGIIQDGALWARDGKIERVGTWDEIKAVAPADADTFDAESRIVLPGFVDAHTHLVFGGSRADEFERRALGESYQSIAASGGGIRSTVRQTRAATELELLISAKRRAHWLLRNGTTTAEIKSGYGLALEHEIKMLRIVRSLGETGTLRVVGTFLGAHEFPDEFRERREDYVELLIDEMLPAVAQEQLAEYADVFCEPHIFNTETAFRIMTAASKLGFGLRMHVDQLSLSGGAQLAARLKAATADHLEQTDEAGMQALRDAGVQPVLLPGSVYALGLERYPAARQMVELGLPIVLATDLNPGSSPTPSIPTVLSLAVTQMKLSVAEAISAVTINAAYSLKRSHEIGSLETGKYADIVIHDCDDYRELAYYFGVEPARQVFIGGESVYER